MAPPTRRTPEHCAQLEGVVSRIVTHADGVWAEIVFAGADSFYREIRVRHPLQNTDGTVTQLNAGDRVIITIKLAL